MADGYFISPKDPGHDQEEISPGVYQRRMAMTDEAMVCEFFFQRGAGVEPHHHMNDQVGYIIYGKIEMTIGDQTRVLNPGDSYAIPGGIVHTSRALLDSLVINVFSPPHSEYHPEAH